MSQRSVFDKLYCMTLRRLHVNDNIFGGLLDDKLPIVNIGGDSEDVYYKSINKLKQYKL